MRARCVPKARRFQCMKGQVVPTEGRHPHGEENDKLHHPRYTVIELPHLAKLLLSYRIPSRR